MVNGKECRKRATRAVKPTPTPREEDLADYIKRKRKEHDPPLSFGDIQERSGGNISKGYLSQIETRKVPGDSLTIERLRHLAVGIDAPYEEILAVASRPASPTTQQTTS